MDVNVHTMDVNVHTQSHTHTLTHIREKVRLQVLSATNALKGTQEFLPVGCMRPIRLLIKGVFTEMRHRGENHGDVARTSHLAPPPPPHTRAEM